MSEPGSAPVFNLVKPHTLPANQPTHPQQTSTHTQQLRSQPQQSKAMPPLPHLPQQTSQQTPQQLPVAAAAAAARLAGKQEVKEDAVMEDNFAANMTAKLRVGEKPALALIYTTSGSLPQLGKYIGKYIEIRIQARHLTIKNREVASGQLWGTDIYTHDSDIVAILIHTGNILARAYPPNCAGLAAIFRVRAPQKDYKSGNRNGIKSKRWNERTPDRFSLEVAHIKVIQDDRQYFDAELNGIKVMKQIRRANARYGAATKENTSRPRSNYIIMYNSDNDPVQKYDLSIFTDLGLGPEHWMSTQCKTQVIYMENHRQRFEISLEPDAQNKKFRTYRFVVLDFPPYDSGYPHAPLYVEDNPLVKFVERGLDWAEFQWSLTGVNIRGKSYRIITIWMVKRTSH